MLVLNLDRLACDAGRLRCAGGSAKGFLGVLLHAHLVLSRCVLNHLRVDRERMKRLQDCQQVALAPIRLAKAMPCWTAFPASSEPSVGIRMLVYIALSLDHCPSAPPYCGTDATRDAVYFSRQTLPPSMGVTITSIA